MVWKSRRDADAERIGMLESDRALETTRVKEYRAALKFLVERDPVLSSSYFKEPDLYSIGLLGGYGDDGFKYYELLTDIKKYKSDELGDKRFLNEDKDRASRKLRLFGAPAKVAKK